MQPNSNDPVLLAQEYLQRGAIAAARGVLAGHDDARALVLLGVADLREGQVAAASARFARAVVAAPDDPIAHAYQAFAQILAGEVDDAKESLARAQTLGPAVFLVRLVEAQCAYRLGCYADAVRASQNALALEAPDPASYALAQNLQRQARERATGNFVRSGSFPRLPAVLRRLSPRRWSGFRAPALAGKGGYPS